MGVKWVIKALFMGFDKDASPGDANRIINAFTGQQMAEHGHPLLTGPSDLRDAILAAGLESTEPIQVIRDLLKAYNQLAKDFANYKAMYGPASPKWVSNSSRRKVKR